MTKLPEITRQRVRERAGNRCEYLSLSTPNDGAAGVGGGILKEQVFNVGKGIYGSFFRGNQSEGRFKA